VHAEDAAVDDGAEAHVVEHLAAVAPDARRAVLLHALVVEAVHLGDLTRLVVAADEGHAVRVPHLEGEEEEERLDRVEAAVDVVTCARSASQLGRFCVSRREREGERTEEEVVGVGALAADAEELEEVPELAMDVAADLRAGGCTVSSCAGSSQTQQREAGAR